MTPSHRILVVDDDRDMVRTLCDVLRHRGFSPEGVFSGEQAVAAARAAPWDAVVMDVKMGGMSGVEAARELHRVRPDLPVILTTAYATSDMLHEADGECVESVLSKPFPPGSLLQTLDSVLRGTVRVLLVDDDPTFLRTLSDALIRKCVRTMRARSVDDALALLHCGSPQLVLLDVLLGETEPRRAASTLKEALPAADLVLYSGNQAVLEDVVATLPSGVCRKALGKTALLDGVWSLIHDR